MSREGMTRKQSAEVVLPCNDVSASVDFFTDELGFRLDSIYPADAPRVAVMSGFGLRLRLDNEATGDPGTLRLISDDRGSRETISAPNGTSVDFVPAKQSLVLPDNKPSLVVSRANNGASFGVGRAGMQYRDLIPDRYGGRFIASHIRIPDGGPVPDYVHHHNIRFQLIYCVHGWVRVVYEDQGPPMLLEAGDCFLQPPHIRHRVLECSDQMEVVEVTCPAEHETLIDHDLELPTSDCNPDRDFAGQRFIFHKAQNANWKPWNADGLEYRDTGIEAATGGIASVIVARKSGDVNAFSLRHNAEIRFLFVIKGDAKLQCAGDEPENLEAGDAVAIPPVMACAFGDISSDFEVFEVTAPATR